MISKIEHGTQKNLHAMTNIGAINSRHMPTTKCVLVRQVISMDFE
jgi:hypothetical protein